MSRSTLLFPKFFSDNTHPSLAYSFAKKISEPLFLLENSPFPDGEPNIVITEKVQGDTCFIFHSSLCPIPPKVWDLLWKIEALKRAGASSIVLIAPYLALNRQGNFSNKPGPFQALLGLLQTLGMDKIFTLNCHSSFPSSFLINLSPLSIWEQALTILGRHDLVLCPLDTGVMRRQGQELLTLKIPVVPLKKHRHGPEKVKFEAAPPEITGKRCLLVDDICSTGLSLTGASLKLQEAGAKEIYAFCTHGVFVSGSVERLDQSPIDHIFLTDSLPLPPQIHHSPQATIFSITSILEQALKTEGYLEIQG